MKSKRGNMKRRKMKRSTRGKMKRSMRGKLKHKKLIKSKRRGQMQRRYSRKMRRMATGGVFSAPRRIVWYYKVLTSADALARGRTMREARLIQGATESKFTTDRLQHSISGSPTQSPRSMMVNDMLKFLQSTKTKPLKDGSYLEPYLVENSGDAQPPVLYNWVIGKGGHIQLKTPIDLADTANAVIDKFHNRSFDEYKNILGTSLQKVTIFALDNAVVVAAEMNLENFKNRVDNFEYSYNVPGADGTVQQQSIFVDKLKALMDAPPPAGAGRRHQNR